MSNAELEAEARVTLDCDTEVAIEGLAGWTVNASGSGSHGAMNWLLFASPL